MSKKRIKRHKSVTPGGRSSIRASAGGSKYRAEKYIQYIFRAEVGIYESSVMSSDMADAQVLQALRKMIGQLKAGKTRVFGSDIEDADDLIAWRITQNWEQLPRLSDADLAGCLTEVLQSAQTRSEMHRGSRGYLSYLEGFMRQMGVNVRMAPASELEEFDLDEDVDLEARPLAEIGETWLQDPELLGADDAFHNRAATMSRQGQAQEVIALCQELLKRAQDPYIRAELYNVAGEAYHQAGDYGQAIAMQQEALKAQPDSIGALDAIAEAYRAMGEPGKAIEAWEDEARREPFNAPHCYDRIVDSYREMGDAASEEAALRRWLAMLRSQATPAGQIVSRLIDLKAKHTTVTAQLADCLRRQGKTAEAESIAERIRRATPAWEAGLSDWAYWTRCQLQAGQGQRALAALEKLEQREIGPVRWEPAVIAAVLDIVGERDQAARRWKQIAEIVKGKPWQWPLTTTRDILGDLVPADSALFKYVKPK